MIDRADPAPRCLFTLGSAALLRPAPLRQAPVVYTHGEEPKHLTLPGHDTMMALKHGGANALVELEVEGELQLALTKQVQVDPIKRFLEHVDFIAVKRGEKVTVDVPIHIAGEAAKETLVVTETAAVSVEAEATHIPEWIEVSVEGAEAGTLIYASDLQLPAGSELLTDPETLVVNVAAQVSEEALEAELESTEDELGIEKDEAEDAEAAEGDE